MKWEKMHSKHIKLDDVQNNNSKNDCGSSSRLLARVATSSSRVESSPDKHVIQRPITADSRSWMTSDQRIK